MTALEKQYYDWIDRNFFQIHKNAPEPFMGPKYFTWFASAAQDELGKLHIELFRVILVEIIVELHDALTSIKRKGK